MRASTWLLASQNKYEQQQQQPQQQTFFIENKATSKRKPQTAKCTAQNPKRKGSERMLDSVSKANATTSAASVEIFYLRGGREVGGR
jgi:hypothetical protein